MASVTLIAAFLGGLVSFLSPCVLPLVPAFLAFLSGTSVQGEHKRGRLFLSSVFYVLGFSVVFSLLGILLNTVLESVSYGVQLWLSRFGGIIIILFGLFLLGLLKIPFLERPHQLRAKSFKNVYLTSFIFGAAFAVGWTPCVGAVLGGVLALAITQPGLGFVLLLTYSLGLGIPFLLVGLFSEKAIFVIDKLGPYLKIFNYVFGIILIILGVLIFTQHLSLLANFGLLNKVLLQ